MLLEAIYMSFTYSSTNLGKIFQQSLYDQISDHSISFPWVLALKITLQAAFKCHLLIQDQILPKKSFVWIKNKDMFKSCSMISTLLKT